MNIMVFDTETTALEKCFCYNIGYVIVNTETGETLTAKDFVIEQIWHNLPLFSSAYYADKRPIYVNRMRARKVKLAKFGQITKEMISDIKFYNVSSAYAYNSPFDEKVFNFNCDWFKCINPFEILPIFDIRAYVHKFIAFTNEFQTFCENNSLFTDAGNYSTTAETLFRFITNNTDFSEEHTALADSEIEAKILMHCLSLGGQLETEYTVYKSIPRKQNKELKIFINGIETKSFKYKKRVNRKDNIYLTD